MTTAARSRFLSRFDVGARPTSARPSERVGATPARSTRDPKHESDVGPAMEQIDALDPDPEVSIERCRELLGDEAIGLSDEQVDQLRRHADTMARVVIDVFLESRQVMP